MKKIGRFLIAFGFLLSSTAAVYAQHDFHHEAPAAPPVPMPTIPEIPRAIALPPEAPSFTAADAYKLTPAERSVRIEDVKEEIRKLEYTIKQKKKEIAEGDKAPLAGSLEEAQRVLESQKKDEAHYLDTIAQWIERIATADNDPYTKYLKKQWEEMLARNYEWLAQLRGEIAYWEGEVKSRQPYIPAHEAKIAEATAQLEKKKAELLALQNPEKPKETAEQEQAPQPETFSAAEFGAEAYFEGTDAGTSAQTPDVTPQKTMQELREADLERAFGDMHSLEFQTGVVSKLDIAGQGAQTIIGFIPGATGADVALSTARGFAEALGEEMAKGTSWDDALKIATVNAGMKGVVSVVGNKLTAGADGIANRVAVLSEVGFAKLTTKQIAEMGSKGISFVVVKSGQFVGQTAAEETVGKPAVGKVADWVKDDKKNASQGSSRSGSASSGGYGLSTATQPLVSY